MFPHNLNANSSTSRAPNVSAYMDAKDRSVKHHPICVEAKATFPLSGESLSESSESMDLRETDQPKMQRFSRKRDNLRDNGIDLFNSMFDLEESFPRR